jgi:hypothetical protein
MREIAVEFIRGSRHFRREQGTGSIYLVPGKPQRWHEIEDERRLLILADPGVLCSPHGSVMPPQGMFTWGTAWGRFQ